MKKMKKLVTVFLVLALISALMVGCRSTSNGTATTGTTRQTTTAAATTTTQTAATTEELEDPVELTLFTRDSASYSYPESGKLPVFEELRNRTNIDITVDAIPSAAYDDTFNLMLATRRELPDIMEIGWRVFNHYDKGIFLPLEDLIYEKAPNIVKHAFEHPSWEGIGVYGAADGHLYSMPRVSTVINFNPTVIRMDLFKELNLEVPKTLDDLVESLKVIRDAKEVTGIVMTGGSQHGFIAHSIGWFGIGTLTNEWAWQYDDNGELIYYGASDKYRQALDFWRMMYSERLIDREYITMDWKRYEEQLINGNVAYTTMSALRLDNYNNQLSAIVPGAYFEAIPPIQTDLGIAYVGSNNPTNIAGHGAAISSSSKNIDAIFKYFDYVYSDEGSLLFTMGIEGETYEMVNGRAKYIGKLGENPTSDAARAEYGILRPTAAIREYTYLFEAVFEGSGALKAYETVKNYVVDFNPDTPELQARNEYEEKYRARKAPRTEENNTTLEPVSAQIVPILDEFRDRYITGETDDWDGYVARLEAAGLSTWKSVIEDRISRYDN